MKKLILFFLTFSLCTSVLADVDSNLEDGPEIDLALPTPVTKARIQKLETWKAGLSLIQWNETLRLEQGGTISDSVANFNGMLFSFQKEFTYQRWGWSLEGLLGSGRANGGTSPTYVESKVFFTLIGGAARTFVRFSNRMNLGLNLLVFNRTADWPDEGSIQADSGKQLNITGMLDMNIRLFHSWEFYQGIAPVGDNASTLWRFGAIYRF